MKKHEKTSKKHHKKEVKTNKILIKNRVEKKIGKKTTPGWSGTFAFGPGGTTNQQDNIQTN